MTLYFCCDSRRREDLRLHTTLNGIDFLEVDDDVALPDSVRLDRQSVLKLYFVKPAADFVIEVDNIRIMGGERITNLKAERVSLDEENERALVITVDRVGDFSTYQLKLVQSLDNHQPPVGIDPRSAKVDFSFKVACESDFDCYEEKICPPSNEEEPVIDYLAKDYASFRRLILDRMSYLMPEWHARTPADMATAVVEVFSYIGDHLSWRQDAAGTEAYLHTAKLRSSIRRHARLVDYHMHDGRNARVWLHVRVNADLTLPSRAQCMTHVEGLSDIITPASAQYAEVLHSGPLVFETMDESKLFVDHNKIEFYTWGDQECCLPAGSTEATLKGHYPNLSSGDVLIFEEIFSPTNSSEEDANPEHRVAVKLAKIELAEDPLYEENVTYIFWGDSDALPIPFCISALVEKQNVDGRVTVEYEPNVTIARGNIVLADHGMQMEDAVGPVPHSSLFYPESSSSDRCKPSKSESILPRFRPKIKYGPVTQAAPSYVTTSASDSLEAPLADVMPQLSLTDNEGFLWSPLPDLINTHRFSRNFVAEQETDGSMFLRFGDNNFGMFPKANDEFNLRTRIGNGDRGNISRETIKHIVTNDSRVDLVRNLLPARGGLDAESIPSVLENAPYAFRTQERAVTEEDWADIAKRHRDVQNAVGTFRWTGSWHTVFITVDRFNGRPVDEAFETELRGFLEKYRLAGYDLEVDGPRYVPLEIKLHICVESNHFREAVKQEVLQVLSNRIQSDLTVGLFHADNFTFGQTVYLSPVVARVHRIEGVQAVYTKIFRRQGHRGRGSLDSGKIELSRLEIARIDNSLNFPEHGVLRLEMEGGV